MKNGLILISIIYTMTLASCNKEVLIDKNASVPEISTRTNGNLGQPLYENNALIVQYLPGTPLATKQSLRNIHDVLSFEACQLCPDQTIEKWFFSDTIQIEPKKKVIEDMSGLEVDFEFDYTPYIGDVEIGSPGDMSYVPFIKPTNTGITIAVLDTGFDHFFPFCYEADGVTPKPLLYNAEFTAAGSEESGWDFVNHDPNVFDDYSGKHGTAVSWIINQILNDAGIPHQILPLKIADHLGSISYFDLVCAYNYAGPRSEVIQMSLGWYDDGEGDFENTIFKNLTETYSAVTLVTSAGNNGLDNEDNHHYPSSYENDNIIAVGSTNIDGSGKAEFSNYGVFSVDFFAHGENLPFYDYENELIEPGLTGTSFAAPQIAGKAAQFLYENEEFMPSDIINLLDLNGTPTDGYYGMVKYDKYYPILVE